MLQNGRTSSRDLDKNNKFLTFSVSPSHHHNSTTTLEWDWDIEHADRKREAKADANLHSATPFQVDRKVLKDVVREKMGVDVARITFLSAGTFHKAYLITLINNSELVARIARRFMPRLKTESEVATLHYLREKTTIPVPSVYHYDSNPYNRLGGEFILMSKAPGVPLAKVYHALSYNELVKLLKNLAAILLPLFARRFSHIGSLYLGPSPSQTTDATPQQPYSAVPFSPTLSMTSLTPKSHPSNSHLKPNTPQEYHIGPIISWPFFGSNRGDLTHPTEINRGPWPTSHSYFHSCTEREINGVILEVQGKCAPHRLHLDPDQIRTSRHHHLKAVPGDQSDDSDEWDKEESEEEWEGPGDVMYRDYRRMQRSTFLVAHISRREECVREEMGRWMRVMERLVDACGVGSGDGVEQFGMDCHDLSLENVFVDTADRSKITCIIDWESTTTRPLWACASLPAFLQSSPFTANIFRGAVTKLGNAHPGAPSVPSHTPRNGGTGELNVGEVNLATAAREWLYYESAGVRLRMAHRCVEWDGWEEGLVDSILGAEGDEEEWFKDVGGEGGCDVGGDGDEEEDEDVAEFVQRQRRLLLRPPPESRSSSSEEGGGAQEIIGSSFTRRKEGQGGVEAGGVGVKKKKVPFGGEKERERVLDVTGDICGGRGGELGRRLEAWLSNGGGGYEAEVEA